MFSSSHIKSKKPNAVSRSNSPSNTSEHSLLTNGSDLNTPTNSASNFETDLRKLSTSKTKLPRAQPNLCSNSSSSVSNNTTKIINNLQETTNALKKPTNVSAKPPRTKFSLEKNGAAAKTQNKTSFQGPSENSTLESVSISKISHFPSKILPPGSISTNSQITSLEFSTKSEKKLTNTSNDTQHSIKTQLQAPNSILSSTIQNLNIKIPVNQNSITSNSCKKTEALNKDNGEDSIISNTSSCLKVPAKNRTSGLTFGLPKLTKISINSYREAATTRSSLAAEGTNTQSIMTKSLNNSSSSTNNGSKIPSISGLFTATKSQLKCPSIQVLTSGQKTNSIATNIKNISNQIQNQVEKHMQISSVPLSANSINKVPVISNSNECSISKKTDILETSDIVKEFQESKNTVEESERFSNSLNVTANNEKEKQDIYEKQNKIIDERNHVENAINFDINDDKNKSQNNQKLKIDKLDSVVKNANLEKTYEIPSMPMRRPAPPPIPNVTVAYNSNDLLLSVKSNNKCDMKLFNNKPSSSLTESSEKSSNSLSNRSSLGVLSPTLKTINYVQNSNKEKEPSPSSLACNSAPFLLTSTPLHKDTSDPSRPPKLSFKFIGNSNTLDRKHKPFDASKISPTSQASLPTNSLFKNVLESNHTSDIFTIPQRNSLNINLKNISNNHSYIAIENRPLSRNPFIEIKSEKLNAEESTSYNVNCEINSNNLNQMEIELENAQNRINSLKNQLNSNSQTIFTLEQTISTLTYKIQSLEFNINKKENIISELKNYIEYIQQKYSKIFDSEKQQVPLCLLNRQNSSDSLNSIQSIFSQKSFHSANIYSSRSGADSNTGGKGGNLFKKRNWLRNSFSRAFSRKHTSGPDQQPPLNLKKDSFQSDSISLNTFGIKSKSSERNSKHFLSDVDENELNQSNNSNCTSGSRFLDYQGVKHSRNFDSGFDGELSFFNSPDYQQSIHSNISEKKSKRNSNNNLSANMITLSNINLKISNDDTETYQRLLRDKEIKLTDIRLEALATAHQLDQSKEDNLRMRMEMEQLKNENLRMQQIISSLNKKTHQQYSNQNLNQPQLTISSPSPSSSVVSSSSASAVLIQSTSNSKNNLDLSLGFQNIETNNAQTFDIVASTSTHSASSSSSSMSILKSPSHFNENQISIVINENMTDLCAIKRVVVSIYVGDLNNPISDILNESEAYYNQILIGSILLTSKTNWDQLDEMIKNLFNDYLNHLESNAVESAGLGLCLDSISYYYVGDKMRSPVNADENKPDLLPYGYLVANHTNIVIKLKDVFTTNYSIDSLCYQTLVPKSVMQRYISLILDHNALLFCGPIGTSKTYMARKIGEYVARRMNREVETCVAYFNMEAKSVKELKHYLENIVEQASVDNDQVPYVLILDNLQNVSNISDAFFEFFSSKNSYQKSSYVIGTINQSNVTSLNLHQNFKWVLCVNHTEPVKNYLKRFTTRRLIDHETRIGSPASNEEKMFASWLPQLWCHVNKYIENYNSIDLVIGPRLFTTYPDNFVQTLDWLAELWNGRLAPMLTEIIQEGIELYGREKGIVEWEDPSHWIKMSWPWAKSQSIKEDILLSSVSSLDVGLMNNDSSCDPSNKNSNIHKKLLTAKVSRSFTSRNSKENDKLINMLVRLQEVTGFQSSVNIENEFKLQKTNSLSLAQCQRSIESSL